MKKAAILVAIPLMLASSASPRAQQARASAAQGSREMASGVFMLAPTSHPPVPRDLSLLWLAPVQAGNAEQTGTAALASAAKFVSSGDFAKALDLLSIPSAQQGRLAAYASYYTGLAQLGLGRSAEARKTFKTLREQNPIGFLAEASALGEADACLNTNDHEAAIALYEQVAKGQPTSIEDVLLRLGRAAKAAGRIDKAGEAFARVYYEFALSDRAPEAGAELAMLDLRPLSPGSQRYKLELGRAERLFGSGQYGAAHDAFETLRRFASGDDKELVRLRVAESHYFLRRFRAAREELQPLLGHAVRRAEALYFYALTLRQLGDHTGYLQTARRVVDEFPMESWAEEALNDLGTYFLRRSDDDSADAVFRELHSRYPKSLHSQRAAWKAGWRAYREDRFEDAIPFFERAAADFPRSDYRPAWLYWAGRAQEAVNGTAAAEPRYALVVADYQNSYYGRLAMERLGPVARTAVSLAPVSTSGESDTGPLPIPLPPNASTVRSLLAAGMYDDAMNELRFARRTWGDSPAITATIAWTNQQQSRSETGRRRFQLMRGAINTMRRAYPQFMAAGGEDLPRDVQTVIFPIAYWDLIRRHAAANGLDPYLTAALVAQESTFVADIRSAADAYGLMQLRPATARQWARRLKMPYSSRVLTDPEANVRIGTAYLAAKIREFGDLHFALASYNAGERPVQQWISAKPGLETEEFIDDIPYPETQGYVKKILGTADDYRRLYGAGVVGTDGVDKTPDAAPMKKQTLQRATPRPKQADAPRRPPTRTRKP